MVRTEHKTFLLKALRIALTFYLLIVFVTGALSFVEEASKAVNTTTLLTPLATSKGDSNIKDFTYFYAAGALNRERILHKPEIDVYDPFLITQSVERTIAPAHGTELYNVIYPPMFFIMSTTLSCFNLADAWKIWFMCSSILLIGTVLLVSFGALSLLEILVVILLSLCNNPAWNLLIGGQTSGFEAFALALSLVLLKRKKYFPSGLAAGLALFKIHFAAIAIIPGACLGRKKFIAAVTLMAVIEGLLAPLIVGPNNVFNCIRETYLCEIAHTYTGLNDIWTMANFRSVMMILNPFNHTAITAIAFGTYFICCLGVLILWFKYYQNLCNKTDKAFELCASVTVIALLLFCPHVYTYDYVYLIIPCIWLFSWSLGAKGKPLAEKSLRYAVRFAVIFTPFFSWSFNWFKLDIWGNIAYFHMLDQAIAAVLLTLAITATMMELKATSVEVANV